MLDKREKIYEIVELLLDGHEERVDTIISVLYEDLFIGLYGGYFAARMTAEEREAIRLAEIRENTKARKEILSSDVEEVPENIDDYLRIKKENSVIRAITDELNKRSRAQTMRDISFPG